MPVSDYSEQDAPPGYIVLRAPGGPSDDQVNAALAVYQGGIAFFFHALRDDASGQGTPTTIIEA